MFFKKIRYLIKITPINVETRDEILYNTISFSNGDSKTEPKIIKGYKKTLITWRNENEGTIFTTTLEGAHELKEFSSYTETWEKTGKHEWDKDLIERVKNIN